MEGGRDRGSVGDKRREEKKKKKKRRIHHVERSSHHHRQLTRPERTKIDYTYGQFTLRKRSMIIIIITSF